MTNIELYKKIEKLLLYLQAWDLAPTLYFDERFYRNRANFQAEILHWMQIGEDSIQILKDKIVEENNNKKPDWQMKPEYIEKMLAI